MLTKQPEMPIGVALDGMAAGDLFNAAVALAAKRPILKLNDALDDPEVGPAALRKLAENGIPWADIKGHDIENTMANRAKKLAAAGAGIITIHASNTVAAMRAAVENRGEADILAVTILTHMTEEECQRIYGRPIKAMVLQFARDANIAGVQGIVCSAKELKFLAHPRFSDLANLIKVTPAMRPLWYQDAHDDQERTMTPAEAIKLGADFLVMGRPILNAGIPMLEAMDRAVKEVMDARAEMAAAAKES